MARNLRILATDDPCIVQARVDTHKKNRQKKFIFSIFFRGEKFARRMSMTDASASPKMSQRILAMNPTCIVLKISILFFFVCEKFARSVSMADASAAPKMSQRILATDDPCIVQVRVDTHKTNRHCFATYCLFYRALLQKRPVNLSLQICS